MVSQVLFFFNLGAVNSNLNGSIYTSPKASRGKKLDLFDSLNKNLKSSKIELAENWEK